MNKFPSLSRCIQNGIPPKQCQIMRQYLDVVKTNKRITKPRNFSLFDDLLKVMKPKPPTFISQKIYIEPNTLNTSQFNNKFDSQASHIHIHDAPPPLFDPNQDGNKSDTNPSPAKSAPFHQKKPGYKNLSFDSSVLKQNNSVLLKRIKGLSQQTLSDMRANAITTLQKSGKKSDTASMNSSQFGFYNPLSSSQQHLRRKSAALKVNNLQFTRDISSPHFQPQVQKRVITLSPQSAAWSQGGISPDKRKIDDELDDDIMSSVVHKKDSNTHNMGSESRPISAIKNPAYQNNSSSAMSTLGKEKAIFVPSFIAPSGSIESNVSLIENTERTNRGVRLGALNKQQTQITSSYISSDKEFNKTYQYIGGNDYIEDQRNHQRNDKKQLSLVRKIKKYKRNSPSLFKTGGGIEFHVPSKLQYIDAGSSQQASILMDSTEQISPLVGRKLSLNSPHQRFHQRYSGQNIDSSKNQPRVTHTSLPNLAKPNQILCNENLLVEVNEGSPKTERIITPGKQKAEQEGYENGPQNQISQLSKKKVNMETQVSYNFSKASLNQFLLPPPQETINFDHSHQRINEIQSKSRSGSPKININCSPSKSSFSPNRKLAVFNRTFNSQKSQQSQLPSGVSAITSSSYYLHQDRLQTQTASLINLDLRTITPKYNNNQEPVHSPVVRANPSIIDRQAIKKRLLLHRANNQPLKQQDMHIVKYKTNKKASSILKTKYQKKSIIQETPATSIKGGTSRLEQLSGIGGGGTGYLQPQYNTRNLEQDSVMMQISKDNDEDNILVDQSKDQQVQTPRTRVCLYQAGKTHKIKPIGQLHRQ